MTVGDPHRIEAERFRLLGHVGDPIAPRHTSTGEETDAELHIGDVSVSHADTGSGSSP